MKSTFAGLAVLLPLLFSAQPPQSQKDAPITLDELQRRQVMGRLGVPLGTAVEIDATIIAGRELRMKTLDSSYLLRVTQVDGKSLEKPTDMEFHPFGRAEIPNSEAGLRALRGRDGSGRHGTEDIHEVEKGYVGKQVRLVAYETGGFGGIPDNPPEEMRVLQGTAFGFHTSLVVFKERPRAGTADGVDDVTKRLKIGMKESQTRKLLEPHTSGSETTYWGGSGARRVTFLLANGRRYSVDFGGGPDGSVVAFGPADEMRTLPSSDGDQDGPAEKPTAAAKQNAKNDSR